MTFWNREAKGRRSALLLAFACGLACGASGQVPCRAYTASDYSAGLPPKGALATLFCTGLPVSEGVQTADGYPLPLELAGVRVRVDGVEAPILAVAGFGLYQQVNFQNPIETDDRAKLPPEPAVYVAYRIEVSSTETTLKTAAYRNPGPAVFMDANGFALAQHASDYSLVTEENPARPGEYVILYATGVVSYSRVINAPALGMPAPFDPLGWTQPATSAQSELRPYIYMGYRDPVIGSTSRFVPQAFVGLMPGGTGVFQINFQVPDDAWAGINYIIVGRGYFERVDPLRPDRFVALNGKGAYIHVRR